MYIKYVQDVLKRSVHGNGTAKKRTHRDGQKKIEDLEMFQNKKIIWLDPEEVLPGSKFIINGESANDIQQGDVGQ